MVRNVTSSTAPASATTDVRVRRTLLGLYQYPIKSCRGTSLDEAIVGRRGIVADRHWMVTHDGGKFLSQRELPRMALIEPRLTNGTLEVTAPGMPALSLPVGGEGHRVDVTVWDDRCVGIDEGDRVAEWFSSFLGEPTRLVRMPDDEVRQVDPTYAATGDQVGFADGFSFLLTSRASLDDLNRRLPTPLPMNRFRPNIMIDGVEPWEEDGWRRIRIDGIELTVAKPCARCAITTTDQNTAERSKEPLRTLATFRNVKGKGVMFGQNLIHHGTGILRVGSDVEVLELGSES